MAITSAICSSFKQELLQGKHSFESSGGHTFKIALFTSSASLGAATTDYSTSNEISNTSGSAYSAGGATLSNKGVSLSSTTAFTDFDDVTISVTGLQIETDLGIEGWGNNVYGRGAWGEFAADIGLGADVSVSGVSFSAATTAFTDFSDVTYSSASFTANGALIYNTTTDGGSGTTDAVAVIAFGGDKTASNGTFKIEFPAADASNAIIRLA